MAISVFLLWVWIRRIGQSGPGEGLPVAPRRNRWPLCHSGNITARPKTNGPGGNLLKDVSIRKNEEFMRGPKAYEFMGLKKQDRGSYDPL